MIQMEVSWDQFPKKNRIFRESVSIKASELQVCFPLVPKISENQSTKLLNGAKSFQNSQLKWMKMLTNAVPTIPRLLGGRKFPWPWT